MKKDQKENNLIIKKMRTEFEIKQKLKELLYIRKEHSDYWTDEQKAGVEMEIYTLNWVLGIAKGKQSKPNSEEE